MTLADDAMRVASGASTIGEDRGVEPWSDPGPDPRIAPAAASTEVPGFALEAAPADPAGEATPKARKPRTLKPRPVVFRSGELVTLNVVEISLEDFRSIRHQVEMAFMDAYGSEPNAAKTSERVRRFFSCLYTEAESPSEIPTP